MHRTDTFRPLRRALACSILLASVTLATHAQSQSTALSPAPSPARQLASLGDEFYQARAHFDPLNYASANGDSRFDDQLGLAIAPQARAQYFASLHRIRDALERLPRASLDREARLDADILDFELESSLEMEPFPEHLLPLSQMDCAPTVLANYASGTGPQPLGTPEQYRAYLRRIGQLPAWIDQAISNMREGMRVGVVQPRSVIVSMLPQFDALVSDTAESNIFYSPITRMPAGFSAHDRAELTSAYQATVSGQLLPALRRLDRFLHDEYLPAGRATSGLGALPQGKAWYLAAIRVNTNLRRSPDEIHALGLREVARIEAEMAALGPRLGYDGPPDRLAQWVASQRKFQPYTSDTQVLEAYRKIYAEVERQLPSYFRRLPQARLSLQLEPELTRATASDHYTPMAADGSHPGVFWPVVNDPREYSTVGMVTLFLHEGVPGHHLHAAILKERGFSDYRKFNTENPDTAAYSEGWALYSETLGHEFGFYADPGSYFGHLNDELLRAVRLVVDTGIHAQGWSREKAIDYAMTHLGYSEPQARAQIERYMVMPAQALAYKTGALKILELRERARKALGPAFQYADFHEIVIGEGTLPLPVLEQQVDAWIAAQARHDGPSH